MLQKHECPVDDREDASELARSFDEVRYGSAKLTLVWPHEVALKRR